MRWCDIQVGDVVLSEYYPFVVDLYLGSCAGGGATYWCRLTTGMLILATTPNNEDPVAGGTVVLRGDKQVFP